MSTPLAAEPEQGVTSAAKSSSPALQVRSDWRLPPFWVLASTALAGAAIALVPMTRVLLLVAASLVVAAVALRPPVAGCALIGLTPLLAGIDRGRLVPVLRPNEALALLLTLGLLARGLTTFRLRHLTAVSVGRVDISILLMAFAGSVLPIAWLVLRGLPVSADDLLYTLQFWKLYGVYVIVRCSIRTERQVRACLWVSLAASALVAVVAILEALKLAGVEQSLSVYYAPFGNVGALDNNRGGSTLALPVAVADLMIFNLAIVAGFLWRDRGHRASLAVLGSLAVAGALASGQFSGVIALGVAAGTSALVARRIRPLAALVPIVLLAGVALRPVLERRLSGFQGATGIPVGWEGRLRNLRTIFWPELFSRYHFLLGVRPAARIAAPAMATGFVWIESGYTWLLWSGGLPLLLAYLYFCWTNLRNGLDVARARSDAIGVAALALVVALVVVGVLMILDPHLTYRGSGDLLFALLALARCKGRGGDGFEVDAHDLSRELHPPTRASDAMAALTS